MRPATGACGVARGASVEQVSIHAEHPFVEPERIPARRLRGRLGGRVSLWCSELGKRRAGLTVTSLMIGSGEPWRVLALLGPLADLTEVLLDSGLATVSLLSAQERLVAEAFGSSIPTPGGPFTVADFVDTAWGPRPATATTWAGVRLRDHRDVGHSVLVECDLEHIEIGPDPGALHHVRGRFAGPPA